MKVSALCVDNGEELAAECLESIRSQGVDEVVVVAGPRTDVELVRRYADVVVGPISPVGWARYVGLLKTSNRIVALCDTDTVYMDGYFKYAVEDFERLPWLAVVKAGYVEPHRPSPLGYLEGAVARVIGAFEYGWVVDKSKLLSALTPRDVEVLKNPRADVGHVAYKLLHRSLVDHRMRVKTRLPTYYFESYLAPAIGAVAPIAGVTIATILGGLEVWLKKALPWSEQQHDDH